MHDLFLVTEGGASAPAGAPPPTGEHGSEGDRSTRPLLDVYNTHGATVSVESDDAAAADAVRRLLEPFRLGEGFTAGPRIVMHTRPEPVPSADGAQVTFDLDYFRVLQAGSKRYIDAPGVGRAILDLADLTADIWTDGWDDDSAWPVTRLLFVPVWAMLLKTDGRFPLHAAGLAREGRALLFPAASGSGKSTLTLTLARAGYDLLGDDTQFVLWDGGRVRIGGFPEKIALREGSRAFFPDLGAREADDTGRVAVAPAELPSAAMLTPVEPGILAFPVLTGRPESAWHPLSPAEALHRLTAYTFFFTDEATVAAHMAAFAALAASSSCVSLDVGLDPARLVECIRRLEAPL